MPGPVDVRDLIRQEAAKAGVPAPLALSVAEQESGFNPTVFGPQLPDGQRAVGTFQLLPSTAKMLGKDPADPLQNIQGGVQYLRQLLDQHNGDLNQVLRTYGGVRSNETYVPQVLGRLSKWQQAGGAGGLADAQAQPQPTASPAPAAVPAPAATTTGAPPQPPHTKTLWERMTGTTSAVPADVQPEMQRAQAIFAGKQAPDTGEDVLLGNIKTPVATPEAREMTAGGVGGALGGYAGSLAGPWSGRAASVAGAYLGGAGEHLGEELLGTAPPPPPGAPPSTMWERAHEAGKTQAAYDVGGQIVGGTVGAIGKRVHQSRIGRLAFEGFESAHQATVKALQDAVDELSAQKAALGDRVSQFGRSVGDAFGLVRQGVGDRGAVAVEEAAAKARDAVARTQALADSATLGTRQAAATATGDVEAKTAAAQAARTTGYDTRIGAPPPEIPAGAQVGETFAGPVTSAKRAAGEHLASVAETGPPQDLTDVITEARAMADRELLPPEQRFPRHAPDVAEDAEPALVDTGVLDASGQPVTRVGEPPPLPDPLASLSAPVSDAEREALIKDPAMPTIMRILNTVDPENVPMGVLHQWVSQLQQANASRGLYSGGARSRAEGLSVKLAGMLREKLGSYAPYNEAAEGYGKIAKLFEEGYGDRLLKAARAEPEKIVQMIRPDDPSATQMLVHALTEVAGQGGGPEGRAQGQAALDAVRHAWLHRNIMQGGLPTLGERLAELQTHPEFVKAFLGDETGQSILKNLGEESRIYQQLVTDGKLELAQAAQKGEQAIATSQAQGKQAVRDVRRAGAGDRLAARQEKKAAQRAVEGKTAGFEEDVRQRGEGQLALSAQQLAQARIALREGRALPPEYEQFLNSTLGPKQQRKIEQVAADAVHAVMHAGSYWGGMSAARLFKGASDKDMLLYAAKSGNFADQMLVKHVWASAKPGWVTAQLLRRQDLATPPPPPPAAPGEISISMTSDPRR